MKSWHFLSIFLIIMAGVALQRYMSVWQKVGLP